MKEGAQNSNGKIYQEDAAPSQRAKKQSTNDWSRGNGDATGGGPQPDHARAHLCVAPAEWFNKASELGTSNAAPIPCAARAMISVKMFGAIPHAADAAVNTKNPAR